MHTFSILISLITTLNLLTLATLTSGAIPEEFNDETLQAEYECNQRAPYNLFFLDCFNAAMRLPDTIRMDFDRDAENRLVIHNPLTPWGEPDSRFLLPQTRSSGSCKVTVRFRDDAFLVKMLWMDIKHAVLHLILKCMGSPQGGGRTRKGIVRLPEVECLMEHS